MDTHNHTLTGWQVNQMDTLCIQQRNKIVLRCLLHITIRGRTNHVAKATGVFLVYQISYG
ncbi:hypothetical protein KUTeg_024934 [Tegillarca granosa]|uniref:Uncharacterized protein n=1 Tax=Tegillarca granosa TaxID=220873 RepID=A0ABQ9DYQ9_TEGGR|nr:hypothetical protein KUTeg_024934 [Tegillarca granosa]